MRKQLQTQKHIHTIHTYCIMYIRMYARTYVCTYCTYADIQTCGINAYCTFGIGVHNSTYVRTYVRTSTKNVYSCHTHLTPTNTNMKVEQHKYMYVRTYIHIKLHTYVWTLWHIVVQYLLCIYKYIQCVVCT